MDRTPLPLVLPALFLLCALPLLLFLAIAVPTNQTSDETAHAIRMDGLRYGAFTAHREQQLDDQGQTYLDSGVTAHPALRDAGNAFPQDTPPEEHVLTRARRDRQDGVPWDPTPGFVGAPATAGIPPSMYLPGTVGMQIAKWLHAGPWRAMLAARVANALTYLVIGLAALLLARQHRGVLFATLLLPTSLWLAASCNPDGLLIATATLATAALTRATLAGWWLAVAALTILAMAEPLYLPLAGVLLATLPGRGAISLRLLGLGLVTGAAIGWQMTVQHYAGTSPPHVESFTAGPYWPGPPNELFDSLDPARQREVLLRRPSLLLTLPFEAMSTQGPLLARQMLGTLGQAGPALPGDLYVLWLAALAALLFGESFASPRDAPGPTGRRRLLVLACVAAAVFTRLDGDYVRSTLTGWAAIQGVQGRRFVPLVPFLFLALPAIRFSGGTAIRDLLRGPAVAAALAGVVVLPTLAVLTYYLH